MAEQYDDNDILTYTFYIDGIKVTVSGPWKDLQKIKRVAKEIMFLRG